MITSSQKVVRCISCELSCQLFPDNTVRSQYCGSASFAVWPVGNHFLQLAVENKILSGNKNHLLRGFIFVDFSMYNLRLLVDPQWIEHLAMTNMHIVLIADRKLEALAHYFFAHHSEIKGIIYSDDDDAILQEKINHLFSGRRVSSRRGNTLNTVEFTLLNRLISGVCLREIIKTTSIDVKKIYVHKIRLERKLGTSIHKILVSIL
ncbi:TPA: helix-turn-helix transcriptional regulator [Enterobacter bugandensis]|uniref:transcriptional regulator n=1 Tax=Enterobacter TaxID=547 RepID=UPI000669A662|nr:MULTISPECIES: transcriptional regulator [Enterobacter]MBE3331572.1 helix-turn-helix transcriptional regulator [Enterobacter cloacae complex sp. P27C]MBE4874226.1 helix-turn-helix transcriptional regulator [Enterobacter cloacae complex sp. P38RS]MBE4916367.1 helix-turn-helix transcriptional regulator [Enterobacter cloacae complex sp. P4RS]MBE4990404.1 helix-turn-helix transcriptional regulator [Enterobacter cloacae complex sp. P6RS]MCK7118210.1 helix-turn-helix transcriptional regulator [Ent